MKMSNVLQSKIIDILEKLEIKNYRIMPNFLVNITKGGVQFPANYTTKTLPVMFGEVEGDFVCSNLGLTTLKGCPRKIRGSFHCSGNNISSLVGGPQIITEDCFIFSRTLDDITGHPKMIGGIHLITSPLLTTEQDSTLEQIPNKILQR